MKEIKEAIREAHKIIRENNFKYDLEAKDFTDIRKYSKGNVGDILYNSFLYGFMQGRKATLEEMKTRV